MEQVMKVKKVKKVFERKEDEEGSYLEKSNSPTHKTLS